MPLQLILIFLVVGSYPWAPQCYFSWEHGFDSIDGKEWCLAYCVARGGPVHPNHCWKFIYLAYAMLLELVVGPGFQPYEDFYVVSLGWPVAAWMCHGSKA
jgi:hypothetical protein